MTKGAGWRNNRQPALFYREDKSKTMNSQNEKKIGPFNLGQILVGIFAIIFLIAGGMTISNLTVDADKAIRELRTEVGANGGAGTLDFALLTEKNKDIVAWIYADGTSIDYPVLQGTDNEFYRTHLFNGKKKGNGSIFMDSAAKADFSDRNTVIYGRNMKDGTMFGCLEEYQAQDFYEAAPVMMLYTPDGSYAVELICGTKESAGFLPKTAFDSDEDFLAYVEEARGRSTFMSDTELLPGDRIVTLCTWESGSNGIYVLTGKLVRQ